MEDEKKNGVDPSLWLMLLNTIFSTSSNNVSNTPSLNVEKEVSYLHGKVDILEKLLVERGDK